MGGVGGPGARRRGPSRRPLRLAPHPGWRMPRTLRVWESLAPTVIEQKVTGQEARFAWRRLVRTHGTSAPGPADVIPAGLTVPPDPLSLATHSVVGMAPGPGRDRNARAPS